MMPGDNGLEPIAHLADLRADHGLLGADNFDAVIAWYRDKLGSHEEERWTVEGLPGVRLASLELNGLRIEVIGGGDGRHAPIPATFGQHLSLKGFRHLCFGTEDGDGG